LSFFYYLALTENDVLKKSTAGVAILWLYKQLTKGKIFGNGSMSDKESNGMFEDGGFIDEMSDLAMIFGGKGRSAGRIGKFLKKGGKFLGKAKGLFSAGGKAAALTASAGAGSAGAIELGANVAGSGAAVAGKGVGLLKGAGSLLKGGGRLLGPLGAILSVMDFGADAAAGYKKGGMGGAIGQAITGDGSKFGNTMKWAGAGMAIGSIIPGVGTLVGGLVGGAIGLLTSVFKKQIDGAFVSKQKTDNEIRKQYEVKKFNKENKLNSKDNIKKMGLFAAAAMSPLAAVAISGYKLNRKIVEKLKNNEKIKTLTDNALDVLKTGKAEAAEITANDIKMNNNKTKLLKDQTDTYKQNIDTMIGLNGEQKSWWDKLKGWIFDKCPICLGRIDSHLTRIVGYFTPVDNWNPVRRTYEFPKRVFS
jgi:hypothetical protein